MMILWAGGLYGLNAICKSVLSQAAGAVVGACRTRETAAITRPIVGMTSLGSSSLKYMLKLKPALEERGFELAVFHTTGMGGRALESLAAKKQFAAVMDFASSRSPTTKTALLSVLAPAGWKAPVWRAYRRSWHREVSP